MPDPGLAVALQAAAIVLAGGDHPGGERYPIRRHVGLVAELDVAVRVQPAHGQRAARPVVLERARQHVDAVGEQGRGQRVALAAVVAVALEAEGDRAIAAEARAPWLWQAARAHSKALRSGNSSAGSKVRSIVSVAVSRSPMNQ